MEENELNKFIHSVVMGQHVHVPLGVLKCGECRLGYDEPNPDYCHDLNAVRKAELKTVEQYGWEKYGLALLAAVRAVRAGLLLAPALTRCRAIKAVWEKENGR